MRWKKILIRPGSFCCQIIVILTISPVIFGADSSAMPDDVYSRIQNINDTSFSTTLVNFPINTEDYGVIPPHSLSEYRKVDVAFEYAPVNISSNNNMYRVMAINYLGEKPLADGRYTYKIEILAGSALKIHFSEDK